MGMDMDIGMTRTWTIQFNVCMGFLRYGFILELFHIIHAYKASNHRDSSLPIYLTIGQAMPQYQVCLPIIYKLLITSWAEYVHSVCRNWQNKEEHR